MFIFGHFTVIEDTNELQSVSALPMEKMLTLQLKRQRWCYTTSSAINYYKNAINISQFEDINNPWHGSFQTSFKRILSGGVNNTLQTLTVLEIENKSQITFTRGDVRNDQGKGNMLRRKERSATRSGIRTFSERDELQASLHKYTTYSNAREWDILTQNDKLYILNLLTSR